ncbi:MAG: type VI secretion system protein TssA [Phycisphaerales bacterium JB037]
MASFEVDALLKEISPEAPCGEASLEYDPEYTELMTLSEGREEVSIGDTVAEAQEPDWRDVRNRAIKLFDRTHDLRVAMVLTVGALSTEGFDGLARGLGVLCGLVQQYWEPMFPRLDPDDGNDPTERVMILDALAKAPGTIGDPYRIQSRIREVPLTNSRQIGRFTYRDVLLSRGDLDPRAGETVADPAAINAAFEDTPLEELQAIHEQLMASTDLAQTLERSLTERVGSASATDLSSFAKLLKGVTETVGEQLTRRGYGEGSLEGGDQPAEGGGGGGGRPASLSGEINSAQDVLLAFDKICRYYERTEPSSPVPLLVKRAKRLVSRSFWDIIRDLSPNAVDEITAISGEGPDSDA